MCTWRTCSKACRRRTFVQDTFYSSFSCELNAVAVTLERVSYLTLAVTLERVSYLTRLLSLALSLASSITRSGALLNPLCPTPATTSLSPLPLPLPLVPLARWPACPPLLCMSLHMAHWRRLQQLRDCACRAHACEQRCGVLAMLSWHAYSELAASRHAICSTRSRSCHP